MGHTLNSNLDVVGLAADLFANLREVDSRQIHVVQCFEVPAMALADDLTDNAAVLVRRTGQEPTELRRRPLGMAARRCVHAGRSPIGINAKDGGGGFRAHSGRSAEMDESRVASFRRLSERADLPSARAGSNGPSCAFACGCDCRALPHVTACGSAQSRRAVRAG